MQKACLLQNLIRSLLFVLAIIRFLLKSFNTIMLDFFMYYAPFNILTVTCRYLQAESKTVDPDQLAFQKPATLDLHCFVCFNALIPSQQFFSHIRTNSCLPGLNSVQSSVYNVLRKDTT